jgi:hypothetical protein
MCSMMWHILGRSNFDFLCFSYKLQSTTERERGSTEASRPNVLGDRLMRQISLAVFSFRKSSTETSESYVVGQKERVSIWYKVSSIWGIV